MTHGDLTHALRSAATGELAWTEDASPSARAVVPLMLDDRPVIAVPYAYADWARSLSTRPRVVLTLSDRRLAAGGWNPLAITAVPRLQEDRDGDLFVDRLLLQELRKHPPARALADSPILRREQWWYLPRLVVHLDVVAVDDFPERTGPQQVLLVTPRPGAEHEPVVRAVRVGDWGRSPLRLEGLDGQPLADSSSALLFGHDFTVPDVERWVSFMTTGRLRALEDGAGLLDAQAPAERVARGMPGLRERIRRHRELQRGCVAGLKI